MSNAKRELRVAGEPLLAIGRRKTDRAVALLFAMVVSGGGWHESRMREGERENAAARTEVAQLRELVFAVSERLTKVEAVSPSERERVADTLNRIDTRLDRIEAKLDTKADKPRWRER